MYAIRSYYGPFHCPGQEKDLELVASVGSAMAPEDGQEPDELLEKADQAMYRMKRRHKLGLRTRGHKKTGA